MKITIIASLIGVLGFDAKDQVVDAILFQKSPNIIAEKLNLTDGGKLIPETVSLVKKLKKKGYTAFVLGNSSIASALEKQVDVKTTIAQVPIEDQELRPELERYAVEAGFVSKPEELHELTRKVSVELTRLRVRKAGEKRDLMVVQAILSVDDLDKTVNLFFGRIREWYGLHFPELDRIVDKHEIYSKIVLSLGQKANFSVAALIEEGISESTASQIADAARNSMGGELDEKDIDQIMALCKHTLGLCRLRQNLTKYADSTVGEVAPNVRALVGSLLASKLIALAGGLTNLAKIPASTIQVLGAEKALFRALKTGTRPPKHGAIFQDPSIHDAKKWQRGKISRALAGKLAIAARADAFTGRYIGDSLKDSLKKRIDEIREKYRQPPQVSRETTMQTRPRRRVDRRHRRKGRKQRGRKR
ncbi:MAG: C/D box methylation guide ribonucleoprotein complex aNOP56 subunit [Candidatus Bathyarchaeota archaeon]|nr:C/D box methylation guide ribonucleoprotein complex aNOP56 subunit [Candidatus Bathyarchaeota archaeon]